MDALQRIPFEQNTDGFNFDTQIIIQLHDAGMRIAEVPIPTYYGDEICYVDGMGYAADVTKDVLAYRLHKAGFGDGSRISLNEEYQLKPSEDSSHGRISTMLAARPPAKILDLGCSSGLLAERLRQMGHHVTGVDVHEFPGVAERMSAFYRADLSEGIPPEVGTGFDLVLMADVLEHLGEPGRPARAVPGPPRPRGVDPRVRPQHRPLVPAHPGHPRHVRLRPAGHPRRHPPAVLHPAQHPAAVERSGYTVRRMEPVGLPSTPSGSRGRRPAWCASSTICW